MNTCKCRRCGEQFAPSEAALRKRNYTCKPCRKIESHQHYLGRKAAGLKVSGTQMSREYHAEYGAEYKKRDYVRRRRLQRFYDRLNDPEEKRKYLTRMKTRNAIRRGDLKRRPCEVCGAERVHAHHDDYSLPLNVRWLCPKHHTEHHRKARGE